MQTYPYLTALMGPPAPMPVSSALRRLAEAAAVLEADGHHPIAAAIRAGRPCIELAVTQRLGTLAHFGRAAYYGHGCDDQGHWRRGLLLGAPQGVTVTWTERGN